jgi:hypothetical protein
MRIHADPDPQHCRALAGAGFHWHCELEGERGLGGVQIHNTAGDGSHRELGGGDEIGVDLFRSPISPKVRKEVLAVISGFEGGRGQASSGLSTVYCSVKVQYQKGLISEWFGSDSLVLDRFRI